MAREIKTTLLLDGEQKYKQGLQSLDRELRVMSSQLTMLSSQYDSNAVSMDNVLQRYSLMKEKSETLQNKVDFLKEAVNESSEAYNKAVQHAEEMAKSHDKNSDEVLKAQNAVKKAEEAMDGYKIRLANAEGQLNRNNQALRNFEIENNLATDEQKKFEKAMQNLYSDMKLTSAQLNTLSSGYNKNSDSISSLVERHKLMQKQVESSQGKVNELKNALNRSQNEYDKAVQKAKEMAEAHGENSDEAKLASQAVERAKASVNEYSTQLANAENQLNQNTNSLNEFERENNALSNPVKKLWTNLKDGVSGAVDSVKNFMTASKAEKFQMINVAVAKITPSFGEIASKINDVTKLTAQMSLKLTAEIGKVSFKTAEAGVQAFAVTTEKSLEVSLKAFTAYTENIAKLGTKIGKWAVETGMSFDSQMSTVKALKSSSYDNAEEFEKDMEQLSEKAKELGQTTSFTATQAGQAMEYMAMAGWSANDILKSTVGVTNLAAASGEDLAMVSDILTDSMTALGMKADEDYKDGISNASHYADVLTAAVTNSNTNIELLGESFKYVAPVAGSLGAKAEDLAVALGLMANSGVKGTQAGNSLKNALVNLVNPTKEQTEAMQELGLIATETVTQFDNEAIEKAQTKVANKTLDLEKAQISYNDALSKYGENSSQAQKALLNLQKAENNLAEAQSALTKAQQGETVSVAGQSLFVDEYGNMKSLSEIMDILRSNLKAVNVDLVDSEGNVREYDDIIAELSQTEEGLTQAEQLKNAAVIFGKRNLAGMLSIVNASDKDYQSLTESINNCDGAAERMANIKLDNLQGDITLLKSNVEGVALSISDKFNPSLRWAVQSASDLVTAFKKDGLSGALKHFSTLIPEISEGLSKSLPSMLGSFMAGINGIIISLVKSVNELLPSFTDKVLPVAIKQFTNLITRLTARMPALLPNIVESGLTLFNGLLDSLNTVTTKLIGELPEIVSGIGEKLLNQGFDFLDKSIQLFENLITAIETVADLILPKIPGIIDRIAERLIEKAPDLLDSALTLFEKLIESLDNVAGKLLPKLPELITNICDKLIEHIDDIIDTGFDLLVGLADGIVQCIPTLLTKIPEVITKLVTEFTKPDNLSQLIQAGVDLIVALAEGLPKTVTSIAEAVPKVTKNIIDTIMETDWLQVGKDIVEGILSGFLDVDFEMNEYFNEFGDNWVTGIKEIFGIHSPSKLMKDEVGKYLALGVGEGFTDNMKSVSEKMKKSVPKTFDTTVNLDAEYRYRQNVNRMDNALSGNFYPSDSVTNNYNTTRNTPVSINITIQNANMSSPQDVYDLAEKLGVAMQVYNTGIGMTQT